MLLIYLNKSYIYLYQNLKEGNFEDLSHKNYQNILEVTKNCTKKYISIQTPEGGDLNVGGAFKHSSRNI